MNLENLPEALFDLLASTPYDELTPVQQDMAAPYLTPKEYMEQYQIIHQLQQMDAELTFEDRILPQTEQLPFYLKVMNYRIPVYQVAAGMIILAACTFAWNRKSSYSDYDRFMQSSPGHSVSDRYYPDSLVFNL